MLHAQYKENPEHVLADQIDSLRKRVKIIKNMQAFGVASLFLCVLCIFVLFAGQVLFGKILFSVSLLLMMISLGLSFWEILLSSHALNIDGFAKSPNPLLRCIPRCFSVRKVRIIARDLRASHLKLFSLPSKSNFLRFYQY
jgi:hypothetical protein